MLQLEKVGKALAAIEECCGTCAICSPDCPVAIARRSMAGLKYDLEQYEADSQEQP